MAKPIVAIVGRPNVGKSTLFNRFVGERRSIVEDKPNVTRDRLYGEANWLDREFIVIDTGGIELHSADIFKREVLGQVQIALDEADLIVFLVDARTGVAGQDKDVANLLRKANKEVILAVNKVDNFTGSKDYLEFYELGLGEPLPISAEHGKNVGDLLEKIHQLLPLPEVNEYEENVIKLSVIGRPNVGKSSLVNRLLGEERVIVNEIPGTTRDAVDIMFSKGEQEYVIIDTAGMRKKKKVTFPVERYSVIRALRAVERSDICLLIIDATEGVTEQDKKIAGFAHEQG
ncbi:MAG: ribosome biogenesis GTPase Der, partial [Halanaerobium sp.]|nr:ribosome biogenesis GTPase Der [Halanaerobium sp.]